MKDLGLTHHSVIRIHHWVLWWIYIGIACGIVAVVNILFRHLTHTQESIILILGVVNWCMGGLICWASEGIRFQKPPEPTKRVQPIRPAPEHEWHSASEFRLPGSNRLLLRFPYKHSSRETLDHYGRFRFPPRQNHHA